MALAVKAVPFWHWRSLRFQTLAVVLIVALAPLLWVWSLEPAVMTSSLPLRLQLQQAATDAATGDPARVARDHRVRVRVIGPDGAVLADEDQDRDGAFERLDRAFFREGPPPSLADFEAGQPPLTERPLVVNAPIGTPRSHCLAGDDLALVVCEAAVRTADGRTVLVQRSNLRALRALYGVRWSLLQLTLLVALLAGALGAWLAVRWVRPLRVLRDAAVARTARPLRAEPIGLDRRDEIGDLAGAFDALLREVRRQGEAREHFVADVAHEMKSPVAALRAVMELIGQEPDGERARRIARILDTSTARLQRTLDQLLELSRAEAGLPGAAFADVDLLALARGVVEHLPPHGVTVVVEGSAVVVSGVAERLEACVRNLLLNATSYAASRVRVEVREGAAEAVLIVEDDGPGIGPDVAPHVFDRFFTTRGEASGTGVGLALVKAVVEAHGGSVTVEAPPGATRFTVRLPR